MQIEDTPGKIEEVGSDIETVRATKTDGEALVPLDLRVGYVH